MNTKEQNIIQAVECIGLMQHSLESLCEGTLKVNPRLFALMAEGPMDQIRDLLNQIDALIAKEVPEEQTTDGVQEEVPAA